MDTNPQEGIVPITEDNMREYFQRVVDHVATLSTQAKQVEGLQQAINSLNERVASLEVDNANLRQELTEARESVTKAEYNYAQASRDLDNERAVTASLRDTMVQRDTAVSTLNQSFENEKAQHSITVADRDDARRHAEEVRVELDATYSQLQSMTSDRDHWLKVASDVTEENKELKGKLERIQRFLNPDVVPFQQTA